jgi:hypothetical protein
VVRPIMGSRRLGDRSPQESWDLDLARHQQALIELGYEGVTVEQVLEQRLRQACRGPEATAAGALAAVEDSIVFLDNPRLVEDLGRRAVDLLARERAVDEAPEVLRRVRRLLGHYQVSGSALPVWCGQLVVTGYAHYCTLLPVAVLDEDTGVQQVGAMLGFLFSMESLALSLGCDRRQLELAVRQSHPQVPSKIALLWAVRFQLGDLSLEELRARCDELLANPLVVASFPQYVSGFVRALDAVPRLAAFTVELLSKAFGRLPDPVLLPWLPTLIITLKEQAGDLMPILTREAGRTFPAALPALDAWVAPWNATPRRPARAGLRGPGAGGAGRDIAGAGPDGSSVHGPVRRFLAAHPAGTDALAGLLGCIGIWSAPDETVAASEPDPAVAAAAGLLATYPAGAQELAVLLGR